MTPREANQHRTKRSNKHRKKATVRVNTSQIYTEINTLLNPKMNQAYIKEKKKKGKNTCMLIQIKEIKIPFKYIQRQIHCQTQKLIKHIFEENSPQD